MGAFQGLTFSSPSQMHREEKNQTPAIQLSQRLGFNQSATYNSTSPGVLYKESMIALQTE